MDQEMTSTGMGQVNTISTLFVSTVTLRLDAKGRVSVPAAFREVLRRQSPGSLLCTTALSVDALDAGGQGLLGDIEALIAAHPGAPAERDQYAAYLFGACETLKIDREGRIVLSERLKIHAGIGDRATFAGLGHKFRIWEPERFRAQMARVAAQLRAPARVLAPSQLAGRRE